jgi:hypothetical protein
VDENARGGSPLDLQLTPGRHTIAASLRGYRSEPRSVDVDANTHAVNLELQPIPLTLHVITDQWKGSVWLDGEMIGPTDGSPVSNIMAGPHTIRFEGGSTSSVDFQFTPGQWPWPATLPPRSQGTQEAILFFTSFDGKTRAQCTCTGANLLIGDQKHTLGDEALEFEVPDGKYPVQLDILGGKNAPIAVTKDPTATLAIFAPKREGEITDSIDGLVRRARAAYNQREYLAADQLVDQALVRDPRNNDAKELKGELDRMNVRVPFR